MPLLTKRNRSALCTLLMKLVMTLTITSSVVTAQEPESKVYELDPFTISEDTVEGYIASNSLAGTRSNTLIKDVPLNIQVFTKDVADDFLITSQVELERYNAALVNGGADSASSNVIQQSYNNFFFRGFQQNWGMRDGVRQYDPIDTQGLSRVEVVKGPAAALYGLAYPGGLMNSVTKTVDFNRDFTDVMFTIASEGEYRATLDANLSAEMESGGTIGLRFNGVHSKTKDYRHNSDGRIDYFQLNLAWQPIKSTKIEFLVEDGYREKTMGLGTFTTAEVDASGNGLGNGADIPIQETHDDIDYNWNWSTGNVRSLDGRMVRGRVTHTFNPDLFVNAYYQYADRVQVDSDGLNASGMNGSAAAWDLGWSSRGGNATGWLNPNTPDEKIAMHWHHRDWQNKNWAYGATLVYNLHLKHFDNTFTVGANVWKEDFITYKHTLPKDSENIVYLPVSSNFRLPGPFVGPPTDMFQDTAGAYETQDNSNDYVFASWQVTALDGKLKTNIAVNKTNFKLIQWANGNEPVPTSITEDDDVSPLYGVVYDVTDDISVFALKSSSLFPTTLRDSFLNQLPPLVGDSTEFGVKLDMMDGKVSGTISYYTIEQTGGGVYDSNAFNRDQEVWDGLSEAERELRYPGKSRSDLSGDYIDGAVQESKGFEADLAIQPNKNWQIIMSYAHNNIEITKHPDSSLVGSMPYSGPIKDQFALMTKYKFTEGQMEGLSMGLGFQWADKSFQGSYTSEITNNTVDRYNPATAYAEVFVGYPFKIGNYDANIRFNVKNLTEQESFVGWQATGSSQIATKRYEVPTERVFSLTFGLHF